MLRAWNQQDGGGNEQTAIEKKEEAHAHVNAIPKSNVGAENLVVQKKQRHFRHHHSWGIDDIKDDEFLDDEGKLYGISHNGLRRSYSEKIPVESR